MINWPGGKAWPSALAAIEAAGIVLSMTDGVPDYNEATVQALIDGADCLGDAKTARIGEINAECRARLIARFGPPEEQVSRSIGVYGAAERDAMLSGVAATIDASNSASNSVLAASTVAAVEAVAVTWPVI